MRTDIKKNKSLINSKHFKEMQQNFRFFGIILEEAFTQLFGKKFLKLL
jgi:hypothetical protein